MKRTLLITAMLFLLPFSGCNHMKEIDEKLEDLDTRLTALEETVRDMSGKLNSIQALLSGKYLVSSVTEMQGGTSFKVVLVQATGETMEIYVTGSTSGNEPPISVRQSTDGNWYWTAGGQWLLAGGERVLASGNGQIPQVRVEDGNWYISMDGKNWTLAGAMLGGEGSMITGVDFNSDPRNVIFTLSDGSTVMLPKSQSMIKLQILFDEDALSSAISGSKVSTDYEVIAPEDVEYVFSSYEPEGWKVEFSEPESNKGTITISVPLHASDAKILIILNGDDGSSYVRVLEVSVQPNPLLSRSEPGVSIDGRERFYSRHYDQIVRMYDGSMLTFGILDPSFNEQLEVSGFDTSLSELDRTTVDVKWKKGGENVLSSSLLVSIEKIEGDRVWLFDDNGNGIIIRM